MKVWGRLTNSAYCDLKKLPPHEVEIELDDNRLVQIVYDRFKKMGLKLTQCSKCGQSMFFLETKAGKMMPITLALISHFADCKFAGNFRKPKG